MLDWPSSSGVLCFIIYNLVGLWVYTWRRNEPPWCPVYLYVRWVEQPLSRCGVKLNLSSPSTVATLIQVKHFFISSTFSVFNIKFIQSVFWISKQECIFTVKCCKIGVFLYIRHEFDTAIVAIFLKIYSKKFSISFFDNMKKSYNNTTLFAFLWLLFFFFFNVVTFLNFGYCQVSCFTLSSRAFSIYVNGVKMHVQHSWKKSIS